MRTLAFVLAQMLVTAAACLAVVAALVGAIPAYLGLLLEFALLAALIYISNKEANS